MSQMPPDMNDFDGPEPRSRRRKKKSGTGIAIAALVLGVIGLACFPFGIVALILGIIGLSRTGTPGADNGRGMAIAGTVLGGVSILLAPLLIAILLPALGASRRTAQRMQNSTQLRGIHQGMLTYANSNKDHYAGLNSKGQIIMDGVDTGSSGDGDTPQARMWILLDGQYFTPDYAISPSETEAFVPYAGGPVKADNYSYALLSLKKGTLNTQGNAYAVDPGSASRAAEWKQTSNSQAIVFSDRNTGRNANTQIQSIHTDTPGEWRGSVLWNDNHVGFENTPIFETKYGSGQLFMQDNLFEDEPTTPAGANALMEHE